MRRVSTIISRATSSRSGPAAARCSQPSSMREVARAIRADEALDALAVEGRLQGPALAEPGVAVVREEAVAEDLAQLGDPARPLRVVLVPRLQDVADAPGMADQVGGDAAEPEAHEVAVVPPGGHQQPDGVGPEGPPASRRRARPGGRGRGQRQAWVGPMITPGSPASLPLRFPRTTVAVVILLAGACLPCLRGPALGLRPRAAPAPPRPRGRAVPGARERSAAATTTPSTCS